MHKRRPRRMFLREHRKAKKLSAQQVAEQLGIERESVLRMEREPNRVTPDKQAAYADAVGVEIEDLWLPPGTPSLDGMVHSAPPGVRDMAVDIVRRLIKAS